MDWLEEEWYVGRISKGISTTHTILLARIKAKMERDTSFVQRIREEGISYLYSWLEIHCKDICTTTELRKIYEMIKDIEL